MILEKGGVTLLSASFAIGISNTNNPAVAIRLLYTYMPGSIRVEYIYIPQNEASNSADLQMNSPVSELAFDTSF